MNVSVKNHSGLGLPAIYLHLVQQVLSARGMNSRQLLVESGLDPDSLLQEENRIPLSTAAVFMHRVIIESREPGLGFLLAEELRLPLHGPLGRAVMSSDNLREVLEMMTRFIALRMPLLQVSNYREGRYAVIEFNIDGPAVLSEFVLDAISVGCVHMGEQIISVDARDHFIERKASEPACFARFSNHLPARVHFERRRNALLFPVEWLDYPVRFSDSEVAQVSRAQCEQTLNQLSRDQGLRPRVRRIITTSHPFPPRLGQVAQSLFMSERTLKRHLQGEGATYQEVVDEVRLERAEKLLTTTRLSLGQISDALGYADAANFTRAFKRWTGVSPSAFRRESAMGKAPAMELAAG